MALVKKDPYLQNQETAITKQFANLRTSNAAQKDEAKRLYEMDLARNANASGGFGGAEMKMREEANRKLNEGFAGKEAEIGAQEIGAQVGLRERESQFSRSLAQASDFFNKEFAENQKTNMVNAMTALKSGGFLGGEGSADKIKAFLDRFGGTYTGTISPAYPAKKKPMI